MTTTTQCPASNARFLFTVTEPCTCAACGQTIPEGFHAFGAYGGSRLTWHGDGDACGQAAEDAALTHRQDLLVGLPSLDSLEEN